MKIKQTEGITKYGYKFVITRVFDGNTITSAILNMKPTKEFKGEIIALKPIEIEIELIERTLSQKGFIPHEISFTAFA
jgi:hypothetical protein